VSTFALRVAIAVFLGLVAALIGAFELGAITASDPAYPEWRRVIQVPFAVAAMLAFGVASWRVRTRRPSVHLAAGGCVLTAAFGVAAFS
jgi:hypothetical protein